MVLHRIFFLNFGSSWTTAWTASSPDLSFLDSYFWGDLRFGVYAAAVSDIQDWQQWIQYGLGMIWLTPGVFQQDRQSLLTRTTFYFEAQGGHWEYFV
jgi:hypothetical protein